MTNRNLVRSSTLAIVLGLLCSGSSNISAQKKNPGGDMHLMGKSISGVDISLKKKPSGQLMSAKTTAEGFTFTNLPLGTYQLTFKAPAVSQARMGKVEYLVVLQQSEPGSNPSAKTSHEPMSQMFRVAPGDTEKGFEFTATWSTSKSNIKQAPAPEARVGSTRAAAQGIDVRGKIFLVEKGTTKLTIDEPGIK